MKNMHIVAGLFTIIMLQACSGQSTRPASGLSAETLANDKQTLNGSTQLVAPEMQIIRELYQSGCLIEKLELNRRKQNMRISCAREFNSDDASI